MEKLIRFAPFKVCAEVPARIIAEPSFTGKSQIAAADER